MAEQKEGKKTFPPKRPSTLKKGLQDQKRKARNRAHKSSVVTAIRKLTSAIEKKEETTDKLNSLYSLMDKGVKKGVFKANKAARTKARFAARIKAS